MKANEMLITYLNNENVITEIIIQDEDENELIIETNEYENVRIINDHEMLYLDVKTWWVSEKGKVYIYVENKKEAGDL